MNRIKKPSELMNPQVRLSSRSVFLRVVGWIEGVQVPPFSNSKNQTLPIQSRHFFMAAPATKSPDTQLDELIASIPVHLKSQAFVGTVSFRLHKWTEETSVATASTKTTRVIQRPGYDLHENTIARNYVEQYGHEVSRMFDTTTSQAAQAIEPQDGIKYVQIMPPAQHVLEPATSISVPCTIPLVVQHTIASSLRPYGGLQ
jgi:hypothetical protein